MEVTDRGSPLEVARAAAEAMYAADAASRHLGIEFDEVAPGSARARMRIGPTMVNGHGIAHGGYVFLLADTAFAFACNSYGRPVVARACDIVFLRPAREGDLLVATATERTRAGRNGIYDVQVTRAADEVIAELRGQSAAVGPGQRA